jgi:hypothetical protein
MKALKERVRNILMNYSDTRNSDDAICIQLWKTYYPQLIVEGRDSFMGSRKDMIYLKSMFDLPSHSDISRARRHVVEHDPTLKPTDPVVIRERRKREDKVKSDLGYKTLAERESELLGEDLNKQFKNKLL